MSSVSEISWEVRGDSCDAYAVSNVECFETEDASVILAASGCKVEVAVPVTRPASLFPPFPPFPLSAWPVRSSRLKASTSRDPFPTTGVVAVPSVVPTPPAVFWNGLGAGLCNPTGAEPILLPRRGDEASPSMSSDSLLYSSYGGPSANWSLNNSASSITVAAAVVAFVSIWGPCAGNRASKSASTESGEEGGGDSTRTFLTILGLIKVVDGGASVDLGRALSCWRNSSPVGCRWW